MDVELTISGLSAAYGKHRVLESVDVEKLHGGQLVGLLGPNASGKTTLIKSLAGVHRGCDGEVDFRVDGTAPRGKRRRQLIGYVPQDLTSTAALRAFEAVLISARREACEDPITRTGEVLHSLGLDAIASRYLNELSGGQRQLVAVAQMLVGNPGLMLLDEPTSALDLRHQVELLQLICHEVRGTDRVALVAIHDLNLAARYCDELLVLKAGRLVGQDTPHAVLTPDLLEDVYGFRARVLDDAGVPVVCPV